MAIADPSKGDGLDQPQKIWVKSTVPKIATLGITTPFISFISFENGRFQDQIAFSLPAISSIDCNKSYRECADSIQSTSLIQGRYKIENDTIYFSQQVLSPFTFGGAKFTSQQFSTQTFSAGQHILPITFQNNSVLRQTPYETSIYRLAKDSDVSDIFGLLFAVPSVSFVQDYGCLVNGHISRSSSKHPDNLSQSLLALARYGAVQKALTEEISQLLDHYTLSRSDLDDAAKEKFDFLTTEEFLTLIATNKMLESYSLERNKGTTFSLPNIPSLSELEMPHMYEDMHPSDLNNLITSLEKRLILAQKSMPALYIVSNAERSELANSLLCHVGTKPD